MATITPANLSYKDKDGDLGEVKSLTDTDVTLLNNALQDIEDLKLAYSPGFVKRDFSNVTQDGKNTAVGWGMPDWDNVISLVWGTQYTADFDCIVYVNPSAQNSAFLTINGTTFDINKNTYAIGVFVPIAKGDTFQTIGGSDTPVIKQIPLKGV